MQRRNILFGLSAWLVLGWALTGCSSKLLLLRKDEEIQLLRDKVEKRDQSLQESQAANETLRKDLATLRKQNEDLDERIQAQVEAVKAERQKADDMVKRQRDLEDRMIKSERGYTTVQTRLAEVQKAAREVTVELSEQKLRTKELEELVKSLNKANSDLRSEVAAKTKSLDQANSDVKRLNVRIRTYEQADPNRPLQVADLSKKVEVLTKEQQKLNDEKQALEEKIQFLQQRLTVAGVSTGGGDVAKGEEDVSFYQDDPKGLWAEVCGLVTKRAQRMLHGEAEWDGADVTLASGGAVALIAVLWVLWTPLRWRKRRRMREELMALQSRVEEMQMYGGGVDGEGHDRSPTKARRRTSNVRRSGKFSPIIAGQSAEVPDGHTVEEAEGDGDEEYEDESDEITVNLGGAGGGAPLSPEDLVKELRAREGVAPQRAETESPESNAAHDVQWQDDDDDGESQDDFANTQIIPSLSELETLRDLPGTGGSGGPSEASKKKGASEDDFLDELKDIIGQKVDEMIQ